MISPISTPRGEGIVTKSTHHAFCAGSIEGTNNMFLNKTSDEGFISTTKSRPEPPSPPHRNNNYEDQRQLLQPQNDEDNDVDMDGALVTARIDLSESSMASPPPISPKRRASPPPIWSKRKRKRHRQDNNQYKEIISLISDDESTISSRNPIVISDDDIDLNRNLNTVLPDFPSPSSMSYNFDDSISNQTGRRSCSPSLSVCSLIDKMAIDIGTMTIRFEAEPHMIGDNNNRTVIMNDDTLANNKVIREWKKVNKRLGINETTMKGLELMNDLSLPRKEGIALINLIRNGYKHVIHHELAYRDRIICLTIGLLEIMNLRESQSNGNEPNRYDKPQILLIAPRKHMALEARKMFMQIARFYEVHHTVLIGGMYSQECVERLSGGLDILFGTPGKLMDMVEKGALTKDKLSNLIAFAMDGADELTSSYTMKCQMKRIVSVFPDRQVRVLWLESVHSAHSTQTAKRYIREIDTGIQNLSDEKENITVYGDNHYDEIQSMTHIEKYVRDPHCADLKQILRYYRIDDVVVFFNSRQSMRRHFKDFINCTDLSRSRSQFYAMDGDCNNMERRHILNNFKQRGGVLFTTDLLNIITLEAQIIINFEFPYFNPITTYIKRSSISLSKTKFVINVIKKLKTERMRYKPLTRDQQNMDRIKRELKIETQSYHSFSQERRRHRSIRGQSILSTSSGSR